MIASRLPTTLRSLVLLLSCGVPLASSPLWLGKSRWAFSETDSPAPRGVPAYDTSIWGAYQRFARSAFTAASIVADYKLTLSRLLPEKESDGSRSLQREEQLAMIHKRAATKLLELCERNGGIYIKLGQHLAQMDYLLPDAYCEALKPLLNACPVQEFAVVERTLCEDLGVHSLSEVFAVFEPYPIASASLAQVHRARLRPDYMIRYQDALSSRERAWLAQQTERESDGPLVAVKVQHRGLAEALQGDIATVQFLVSAAERLFPGSFEMQWLVNEIRDNLPRELNFVLERQNGDRCRQHLVTGCDSHGNRRARPRFDALVPEFLPSLSTSRVLTMSYETGVPANDIEGIRRLGLRSRGVAYIIDDVFTDQIFCFGFVHSDPHAGNILVRPRLDDPSKPVIVLLDHGLYRELDDSFRLAYAALWQGIVAGDDVCIRREALRMGVPPEDVELFTAMLTTRSWQDVVNHAERRAEQRLGLAEQRTAQDKQRVQDYVREHVLAMNRLLGRIPRPLLLLLKTNDCLRALDRRLGATAIMVEMIARKTAATLAERAFSDWMQQERTNRGGVVVSAKDPIHSLWEMMRLSWRRLRLELRLLAFRVLVWWHQIRSASSLFLHRMYGTIRSADDAND